MKNLFKMLVVFVIVGILMSACASPAAAPTTVPAAEATSAPAVEAKKLVVTG